jgi:membrane fusion protein (multidrug efflux system)
VRELAPGLQAWAVVAIRWRSTIIAVVVLIAIIGGLAGIKACQISRLIAVGETMKKAGPPPEPVGSAIAERRAWELRLEAVGTVSGVQSVTVSNDAAGVVTRMRFDSGARVQRGQALVELEANVERAQLSSAIARRDLARVTARRGRELFAARAIPQSDLDADEAQLLAADSDVASLQAQIDHKIVRAPFDGRAGIRAVNVGQYLPAGTTVTTVDSIGELWVDFSLPQEQLSQLHVGTPVTVALRGQPTEEGTITAIDPTIDASTRNIKLRATLRGRHSALRSGMFVTVSVALATKTDVVVLPATAIVHASYGDSVYVIADKPPGSPGMAQTPEGKEVKRAQQQFVRVGEARGDFVAIREGLAAGLRVVSIGAFKLHNGSPIVIDDSVKPKPELEPHPENR